MSEFELIVPCHFGMESVLKNEIYDIGYEITEVSDGRVTFLGDEEAIARANVFLRTGERVLLKVGSFHAETYEELFQGTLSLPWEEFLPADARFWVTKAASVKSKLFSPSDIQSVMKEKGLAHIGIGEGQGDEKANEAVQQAVSSPLLETKIDGATDVIVNVSGDISLLDASDAVNYVKDLVGESANIIFGAKADESMTDMIKVTVIATGLEEDQKQKSFLGGMHYANQNPISGIGAGAARTQATSRPNTGFGRPATANTQTASATATRPAAGTTPGGFTGLTKPTQPTSNVKEVNITIPDFLKKK